ncbi:hypothetical protein [Streptomyces buecherae]|uniref:hypothetical protein n=1 Tax=Streptomyces buecherae TaxID=2763006 RepID=UPI001C26137A|nr:hypothetical protein [Streptomyces buecherae]
MAITILSPERAYAFAPPIASEIAWTQQPADPSDQDCLTHREWWLRRAAALDRLLLENPASSPEVIEEAAAAAIYLLDSDRGPRDQDPRVYVRHAYHAWRRADLITTGRCPNCGWVAYQCACADHPDA